MGDGVRVHTGKGVHERGCLDTGEGVHSCLAKGEDKCERVVVVYAWVNMIQVALADYQECGAM